MLLVIDAGNTNITFGVFDGPGLRTHWRLSTLVGRTADEYTALLSYLFLSSKLSFTDIDAIAMDSVVPRATPDIVKLCSQSFGIEPVQVTGHSDLGLEIAYHPASDVGADRLADAVAALNRYGAPCIVIDFGTATTFNAIIAPKSDGQLPIYLGGAICLGIGVSLDALFSRAAQIPRIDIASPAQAIGTNTIDALQSGIVFGYVAQVDGMVARFRDEMQSPNCPVIATGGYSSLIARESYSITSVDEMLTLDGLRLIHDRAKSSKL